MLQQELVRRTKNEPRILDVTRYFGGICSSCTYNADCTFSLDPERPVIQCDEFSPELNHMITPVRKNILSHLRLVPTHHMEVGGLCRSCVIFPNCSYPKTSAGSIFCDEYSNGLEVEKIGKLHV
jgi:hypothetical protein